MNPKYRSIIQGKTIYYRNDQVPGVLKTKTVVGVGVNFCVVVRGDVTVGTAVVSQGVKVLSIVPLAEHLPVIHPPSPSVV